MHKTLRTCVVLICASVLMTASPVRAQDRPGTPKAGSVFLQGGLLVTSLVDDTQDPGPGYLHYNFIGTLDWPAIGGSFGGGAFVGRHWGVGAEMARRETQSTIMSEQEYEHVNHGERTSLYTSRERLFSAVLRFHAAAGRRIEVQPLGGVTRSWASRSLTDRHGSYVSVGFVTVPIFAPDVTLDENKWGVGGGDAALGVGGGVSIVCSPRLHWIHRDKFDSYSHTVPNASRVIASAAFGDPVASAQPALTVSGVQK